MTNQLNDVAVLVNNDIIAYEANTLSYADGFGEFSVRNAVIGGGQTEQVFSEDLATKFGMVKFSMPSTEDAAKLVREWKNNQNNNVVELQSATGGACRDDKNLRPTGYLPTFVDSLVEKQLLELEFLYGAWEGESQGNGRS